jgi:hypothetical protein
VTPLVLYEIANDVIYILPKDFTIREDTVDRLSDAAQTLGPFLVLKCEVTDLCSRSGIAIAHVSVQNAAAPTTPRSSFDVDCPAGGGQAARTYDLPDANVDLTYSVPPGTWIAVSALVPDPATAP